MMQRALRWYDFITINIYWLGLNMATSVITPVLLPFLVALYVPADVKNTYLANIRVISLAVAMLVQPLAGMFSDRSISRYGRRRPYIFGGASLNVVFLLIVGLSYSFSDLAQDGFASTAYWLLMGGIVLLQVSSNIAHGALQGLIPDLVPEDQRGRASGVKAVMELLPVLLVLFIGPLVDRGQIWLVIAIVAASYLITMGITVLTVREEALTVKPKDPIREPILRLVALTAVFLGVTQAVVWLIRRSSDGLFAGELSQTAQIALIGGLGLAGMAGAILIGVYLGARIGIGAGASEHSSFIWWVVNRLLFLAAIGSVQGFAQYFLADVIGIPNAASMTTVLLGVVALFLLPSALGSGYLADRIGRIRLVAAAGVLAALGTLLLLFAREMPMVIVAGSIIGLGGGTFMATNWALGTDLAPKGQAGKYLGISNLAGAGAGIIGTGIGGPMADFLNGIQPGLGYLVIFAIYAALFLLSSVVLLKVHPRGELV
ncbi:MAG: MFS transporter [Anaerolineales bacterium]|nr:MFS transporter [Anaerolineales bacterium]